VLRRDVAAVSGRGGLGYVDERPVPTACSGITSAALIIAVEGRSPLAIKREQVLDPAAWIAIPLPKMPAR